MKKEKYAMIELRVKNHPGVMYRITGLFARRAFNLEGIFCARIGSGLESLIYLLVLRDARLEQLKKELGNQHDILEIELLEGVSERTFARMYRQIRREIERMKI